jgi:hypothetical protein
MAKIKEHDSRLLLIFLVIFFLGAIYQDGMVAGGMGAASVLIVGCTAIAQFDFLMRIIKKNPLPVKYYVSLLAIFSASLLLIFFDRGIYVVIAVVPGLILGSSSYLFGRFYS